MALGKYIKKLKDSYKENKGTFIFYLILRAMVILTMIRCIITKEYESVATCVLVLVLFLLPAFIEDIIDVKIPGVFQGIIFAFIFAAEILGEINHYYVKIPGWDTMLHTINGFLFAAVGFSLIFLLNRGSKNFNLSPLYLTLVAFCFSMTIGVLWEFFECSMDLFFNMDMQKDFIVQKFSSVTLDPAQGGEVIHVQDITGTVITTASGQTYNIDGGYLDIGILDSMKDLLVNLIGAVVFSVIGFFTIKTAKPNKITEGLVILPKGLTEDDLKEMAKAREAEKAAEKNEEDET